MTPSDVTIDWDARRNLDSHPEADLSSEVGFKAAMKRFCTREAIVELTRLGPCGASQPLLLARLKSAGLLLLGAFSLFLLQALLMPPIDAARMVARIGSMGAVVAILVFLSRARGLSIGKLRLIEALMFAAPIAFFAFVQYQNTLLALRFAPDQAPLAMKSTIIHVYIILAIYGLFIPNTWTRAAKIIIPIAFGPIVVAVLTKLMHPELRSVAHSVITLHQMIENGLLLVVAATTLIYGTYVINALRVEAIEARQLGQYKIKRRLGAGGMGEVFLAEHQLMKRPCALKLIRANAAHDPRALARFEREVRHTARLSHWNTVEIYDYGRTHDGTFYYVMEYLPGMSFADIVTHYGPMSPARVVYLLRQACQALTEAHTLGLVHRDLKPANLFAARRGGRDDVTKLLDFGLVKPTIDSESNDLSQERVITGSPLYMSPEQASGGGVVDRRSDLYSMGAVAYYLLTGRPPFPGENAIQVMIAHARDTVAPPTRLRPEIPADLEQVVLKCLEKEPALRYQDAEELERALAGCACAHDWDAAHAAHWWIEVAHCDSRKTICDDETEDSTPSAADFQSATIAYRHRDASSSDDTPRGNGADLDSTTGAAQSSDAVAAV